MAAVVSLEPRFLDPERRPVLRLVPGVPALPEPYRRTRPQPARCHQPAAVYRRRRVLAALVGLGVVLVGARVGSALGGNSLAAAERLPHVQQVVVEPGDSLWSIAQRVAPGHDPRPIVDSLEAQVGTGPLHIGQTLSVPAP